MKNFLTWIFFLPQILLGIDLVEISQKLPGVEAAIITPISGGATNQNYTIEKEGQKYFVRIGQATDTDLERLAAAIASQQGIGPSIVLYIPEEKVLVSEFLTSEKFEWTTENKTRFVNKVKALHQNKAFPRKFDLYDVLERYPHFQALIPFVHENREWVLCHLDLHDGNLIYSNENLWIIDWEYAALADPLHDLASFASVQKMSDEEMKELLSLYLNEWDESIWNDLLIFRIWHDVRWADWCEARECSSLLDYPYAESRKAFMQEAEDRLSRLELF